jgi:NO-binding membrane sensor protein with MHYT domain
MEYGAYVPLVAYVVSCVGCALGLVCTIRARVGTRISRNIWLVISAVSIGGTGIWGMHFVGMLGVTVHGSVVRWDVPRTILSLVVAVAVVGVGMFHVGYGAPRPRTLITAGLITGSGVAIMHYTGMAAMRVQGTIEYNLRIVALSVLIAVVAATAALWITQNVRRPLAAAGAVPIMGLAVSGMHYTGMAATTIVPNGNPVTTGAPTADFIIPLMIGIIGSAILTLFIVALSPSAEEVLEDAQCRDLELGLGRSAVPEAGMP